MAQRVYLHSVRELIYFNTSVSLIVLSTTAVALRFWSRAIGPKGSIGWDDWLCLAALILAQATYGCVIANSCISLHTGRGAPTPESDIGDNLINKLVLVSLFLGAVALTLIKTSALRFYGRIFYGQAMWFRVALRAGHCLVYAWAIYLIVSYSFHLPTQFTNVDGNEPPALAPNGLGMTIYLVNAVADVVTDLYILLLPVPLLWRLNMRRETKLLVVAAFLLGHSLLITSLGRLAVTIELKRSNQPSVNIRDILEWATCEPGLGIISICVPSWWHLYRRGREHGVHALFTRDSFQRDESQVMAAARERERKGRRQQREEELREREEQETDLEV